MPASESATKKNAPGAIPPRERRPFGIWTFHVVFFYPGFKGLTQFIEIWQAPWDRPVTAARSGMDADRASAVPREKNAAPPIQGRIDILPWF
jgi:hypothetical protein